MTEHNEDDLLEDLREAEIASGHRAQCDACDILAAVSESTRPALSAAMAGTIGAQKLSAILTRRGYAVGRRAIDRHRREGHTP